MRILYRVNRQPATKNNRENKCQLLVDSLRNSRFNMPVFLFYTISPSLDVQQLMRKLAVRATTDSSCVQDRCPLVQTVLNLAGIANTNYEATIVSIVHVIEFMHTLLVLL